MFSLIVIVPEPMSTFSPMTLSPTNDSRPIFELPKRTQFFSSTP